MPTILLKKSDTPSSVPTTANLTNLAGGAEVAVNTADKRLFTMDSSSAVVELGTNPSSLSIANNASINILTATTATITTLNATSATVTTLGSTSANITTLTGTSMNVTTATHASANVTTLTGTSATITNILDGVGNVRNIPSAGSAKTSAYTLAITDIGEFVTLGASGAIVVPNDVFVAGNAVSLFNNTSGAVTVSLTITTAYIGGTDSDKASVSLATRGVATILFVSPSLCVLTGNVS
jgi:hypothetical protein